MATVAYPTAPRRFSVSLTIRFLCWLALAWIAIVGALSLLLHFQVDPTSARRYFSDEQIDDGLRYGFESKIIGWSSGLVHYAFLAALGLTTLGGRVTAGFRRLSADRWFLTLVCVAAFLYLAPVLLGFPFSVLAYLHRRAWDMTQATFGVWIIDYLKSILVSGLMETVPLIVLYLLIRGLPRFWWLVASAALILYAVGIALLYPIVVEPFFNTFTPLSQTRWAHLEKPVRELLKKADLPVEDILVIDASRRTSHSNAYFTGFGPTRRIVFYDTLLKDHRDDETLSILGHEMGHWLNDHIVKGLAMAAVGATLALFLLSRILLGLVGRPPWRLSNPSDPAGLPLVFLLGVLATWVTLPIQNAVSRYFERQADEMALRLGARDAFIRAEQQLVRTNKSNVTPHPFLTWLFATHPPVLERIEMGERWDNGPPQERRK
ncbi:MAG: M48 family metallopeptidase [Gemmataceae bacterium]